MKKNDIYIIICFVALSLGVLLINCINNEKGETAIIYLNDEVYETISLNDEKVVRVNNTNIVRVKNGKVFMESANCPDQVCVHQAPLDMSGRDIVCLPNRVIIRVISENNGVDAVVN